MGAETAIVVGDGECDRLEGLQDCAVLVMCTNADVGYVRAVDVCTGRTLWQEERMNSVSCVAHWEVLLTLSPMCGERLCAVVSWGPCRLWATFDSWSSQRWATRLACCSQDREAGTLSSLDLTMY